MIGYVTIGTNDLAKAREYYDALFQSIGASRLMELPHGFTLYGTDWRRPGVAITPPYDGGTAAPGNGNMIALVVDSRAKVDAFHARALELGGSDEGGPGLRGPEGDRAFYGAYFRDPEGNKICVFRMGPA
ncbi:VOC family protein [Sphingosinicella sp. CPCC 101087]|uniref:VOC family protein n=1 Tax=Sphingosinicella sp. CPCC 101087 TaxID=2497754 RepID=UPI00101D898B|nr:VOC family protein [Sphingosinicella sp. CPCC 101087]